MGTWLKRLALGGGVFIGAALLLLVLGSGVGRYLSSSRAERIFPPPGTLVSIDGRDAHLHCIGEGTPTIVLESGLDTGGSTSWELVHSQLARISRTCAYDRAGILWSEPGPEPRDAERIAGELHALLAAGSVSPPYVLVGHSMGGLYSLVYDRRFPGEAAGFVFVDSSHPRQDARLPAEVRIRFEDATEPPRWLMRILTPFRVFIDAGRSAERAYWYRSFPEGVLGETETVAVSSLQAERTRSLGDRPVVVLTAAETWGAMAGISEAGVAEAKVVWRELQAELAGLSSRSAHRIVEGADHYIQEDAPDVVVAAVSDVVGAVRGDDGAFAQAAAP